jgi:hypothetical protein
MHLLFVDESGTPAKHGNDNPEYFVIAGLAIPDGAWMPLHKRLQGLKIAWRYRGEVKWRFFAPRNRDEENPMAEWDFDRRCDFRKQIFKMLRDANGATLLACVSQAGPAYSLPVVNNQNDLYYRTYKPLTERFQYFLQDRSPNRDNPEYGMIVADHRGRGDDQRLRRQHQRLVETDVRFTSTYKNLVEGLFLTESHMSTGIQLVDMVAGAVWRRFECDDTTSFDEIRSLFRTNRGGAIDGYGICRFPKQGWTGVLV